MHRSFLTRLWTRIGTPRAAASEPAPERSATDARCDPAERAGEPPNPEQLPAVPFHLQTCTIADPPTDAQQAACHAHVRACSTVEEFWQRAPSADWMLDLLRAKWETIPVAPERQLRTFALRCVDGLKGVDDPRLRDLINAVKHRVDGEATLDALTALQESARALVVPGGLQGLPRCSPQAAGALAVWHTAGRNPYTAGFWTAEFAALHDAFAVLATEAEAWRWPDDRGDPWRKPWRTAFFAKAHPAIRAEALREARRRQADLLRTILPEPFAQLGGPVRAEVYFGKADAAGMTSVYCLTCGVDRAGASPGVLFDVRRIKCKACGVPFTRRIS